MGKREFDLNEQIGLPSRTMTDAGVQALVKRYRGRRVYVPTNLHELHPLVQLLGQADAHALKDAVGAGNKHEIGHLAKFKTACRDAIIRDALSNGLSQADAANRLGLSRRTIQRIAKAGQS